MKKVLALILMVAILGATGCAGIKNQTTRTTTEGAGAGAIVGGLIGAVIGGRTGAAWGAAVGAALGGTIGYHIAQAKNKYASQEKWLDACIAEASKTNTAMLNYNTKLSSRIDDLTQSSNALLAKYRQRNVRKSQLLQEKAKIKNQLIEANKMVALVQKDIDAYGSVLQKEKIKNSNQQAQLSQEVKNLEERKSELNQQIERLASLPVNNV